MQLYIIAVCIFFTTLAAEGNRIRCGRRQFKCANGRQCIPAFRFCDGRVDCSDRSDERRPKRWGLRCQKGIRVCLLPKWYSPRISLFCNKPPIRDVELKTCEPDEFRCNDGSSCIPLRDFCNGRNDCRDGSDEVTRGASYNITTDRPCKIGSHVCVLPSSLRPKREEICDTDSACWNDEFRCEAENRCIPRQWFCDGSADCENGEDEIQLPSELQGTACQRPRGACLLPEIYQPDLFCQSEVECLEGEFKCLDGTQCIPWRRFCSGQSECRDGSDEISTLSDVPGMPCRRSRNLCILPEGRENMREEICLPESECSEDEFACLDGTQCIPWNQACDGMNTCRDKSDELHVTSGHLGVSCRRGNVLCTIPFQYSHKAEEHCDGDAMCDQDEYSCVDGRQCIPKDQLCDGSIECRDLSDEIKPMERNYGVPCKRGREMCVLPEEAESLRDEVCETDRSCISGYRCEDGLQCIPKEWFCDGTVHCRDGSDEIGIDKRAKGRSGIRCETGKGVCLLPAQQAFKRNNICHRRRDVQCRPDEFKCSDGSECLKSSWFCDGETYCRDGSDSIVTKTTLPEGAIRCRFDEFICALPMDQLSKKDYLCRKDVRCGEGEFACVDGSRCLEGQYFCDGYKDCSDGSDEINPTSDVAGVTCRGTRNSWLYYGAHKGVKGGNWCILPEAQKSKKNRLCNN